MKHTFTRVRNVLFCLIGGGVLTTSWAYTNVNTSINVSVDADQNYYVRSLRQNGQGGLGNRYAFMYDDAEIITYDDPSVYAGAGDVQTNDQNVTVKNVGANAYQYHFANSFDFTVTVDGSEVSHSGAGFLGRMGGGCFSSAGSSNAATALPSPDKSEGAGPYNDNEDASRGSVLKTSGSFTFRYDAFKWRITPVEYEGKTYYTFRNVLTRRYVYFKEGQASKNVCNADVFKNNPWPVYNVYMVAEEPDASAADYKGYLWDLTSNNIKSVLGDRYLCSHPMRDLTPASQYYAVEKAKNGETNHITFLKLTSITPVLTADPESVAFSGQLTEGGSFSDETAVAVSTRDMGAVSAQLSEVDDAATIEASLSGDEVTVSASAAAVGTFERILTLSAQDEFNNAYTVEIPVSLTLTQSGSGVADVRDDAAASDVEGYYSLTGAHLPAEPSRGFFLIRHADGSFTKVVR